MPLYKLIEWRLGDSLGISVTDETLQRSEAAHRTPQESAQSERRSTSHYDGELPYIYFCILLTFFFQFLELSMKVHYIPVDIKGMMKMIF